MFSTPRPLVIGLALATIFPACKEGGGTSGKDRGEGRNVPTTYVMDPHSNAKPTDAVITHLDLDIQVDMDAHRIRGTANYDIRANGHDSIVLDTDGLTIERVTAGDQELPFTLGDSTFLGRALRIALPAGTARISVAYSTGPGARALQWLSPAQTTDKKKPFLFTQGQAILTRTWIPVQDSPGIRITYYARVQVPKDLMAVMSAENPQTISPEGVYEFRMERPIPPYLIALAVGDLGFKATGERTGVYAEKSILDTAAWELADTEKMVKVAEELYGPYRWKRYDVIFLPASFPFGGMENPMLTFATPTILAGDRSLNALIAHELAHSWSGNLVTNATWNDFWLNEGFTVYFEHRITEALYGKDYNDMTNVLGFQDLQHTLGDIAKSAHPEDSKLRLDLAGRDPDEGMNDVAYEKGYALLRSIEQKVGRPRFDKFLRGYFDAHAFSSITTDAFVAYLHKELLDPAKVDLDLTAWIDGEGLPADVIVPVTDRFQLVERQIERWSEGVPAKDLATNGWSTFEWMHFLRHLPPGLTRAQLDDLDGTFHFMRTGNAEVLAAWLEQCILNDYDASYVRLDAFLSTVGRRKFLEPLYTALVRTEKGRIIANGIYAGARPNYHSVSARTIDRMLGWESSSSVSL